ncbi:MAG: copper resistance protein CopC [Actinomycetota bacterium]|nr:copper resistance protein CopC [Actinomycetota bacterium]
MTRARRRRWTLGWAGATLLALAVLVIGATPASAHAVLQSSNPSPGSEQAAAPTAVVLDFDEGVSLTRQSVRVLDPSGHDVTAGPVGHPGGRDERVGVPLAASLPRGSYLVIWRVVSHDSHPVSGTFTFGVGVPAAARAATDSVTPSDPVVAALHGALQFEALAGAGLLLGAGFFLAAVWPAGLRRRPCRSLLTGAWWASMVSTIGLAVLQGPYGGTLPLSATGDVALLGDTLGSTYGRLLLLRMVALAAGAGVWWAVQRRGFRPGRFDLLGLAVLLLESFSFAGHAGQGTLVLLWSSVDAAHLAAAGIWVGGLLVLAVVLPRGVGNDARSDGLAPVLRRWSGVAATAVGVLVVTGVAQGLREVGGWEALARTTYGQILLAKVAGLALMLGLALVARRRVTGGRRPARATVTVEAGLGVVVIALAAALTSSVPARDAYQPTFSTTVVGRGPAGQERRVAVVIRPTTPGYEGMSVRVTTVAGAPVRLSKASGSLVDTDLGIGPLTQTMTVSPSGIVDDVLISVPSPGRWEVTLRLTTAEGASYAASLAYQVG